MKKITAILLAMIVVAMCTVTTFAAPATTVGTVYDFVANFETATAAGFSFAINHKTHGMMQLTTSWFDGTQEMGPNNKGVHPGSGSQLTGWGYYNNDGWGCCTGYLGGTNIVWAAGDQMVNIIVFTAPVTGLYSYDMEGSQYWNTEASTAKYYVEVDGEIHNENTASFEMNKTKEETAYNFEGTVELAKGETIYFCYDPEDSAAGDNGQITKLQVKLDRVGRAPIQNVAGAVYDLVENFSEPEYVSFSFKANHEVNGMLDTTTTWYNGDDASVTHEANGAALRGFNIADTNGDGVGIGYVNGNNLVWFPRYNVENIIVFTAPVAGTYTYEFTSHSLWKTSHSTADYYLAINEETVDTKSVALNTEPADSAVTFTGTVELKAGETIWYVNTDGDNSSGDNSVLDVCKVTLVEVDASAPAPTPNPGTSDVAVSIAVAIAAAAVVGLAVVAKKH